MKRLVMVLLLSTLSTLLMAQEARHPVPPPTPPQPVAPPPGPTRLPVAGAVESKDVQIRVLRAQRDFRSAQADMANLEAQYQSLQSQMNALKSQAPAANNRVATTQAELQKAKDDALKSISLDPAKYELDDDMIARPKAAPAPSTPSPEKK